MSKSEVSPVENHHFQSMATQLDDCDLKLRDLLNIQSELIENLRIRNETFSRRTLRSNFQNFTTFTALKSHLTFILSILGCSNYLFTYQFTHSITHNPTIHLPTHTHNPTIHLPTHTHNPTNRSGDHADSRRHVEDTQVFEEDRKVEERYERGGWKDEVDEGDVCSCVAETSKNDGTRKEQEEDTGEEEKGRRSGSTSVQHDTNHTEYKKGTECGVY